MNTWSPYALGLCLLCAVSCPALADEQSPRLVVTEGHYIGYVSVADALATLQSRGLMPTPGVNGAVSFVEPDHATAWTFAGKEDPAYPSAVRYVYRRSSGVLNAEVTILCEASAGPCEKFRSDIREKLAQLSKMMAGDPSAQCRADGGTMSCLAEPERGETPRQLVVRVGDDAGCSLDEVPTPCPDLGRKIRADHPSDDPQVAVCASAKADRDAVGKVLSALTGDHLSAALGCPPH
jgi:hypothetical protein